MLFHCLQFHSHQGYPSENPEADNAVQVFRMPDSNVHSQVLPSTSEVPLFSPFFPIVPFCITRCLYLFDILWADYFSPCSLGFSVLSQAER